MDRNYVRWFCFDSRQLVNAAILGGGDDDDAHHAHRARAAEIVSGRGHDNGREGEGGGHDSHVCPLF